MVKSGLRILCTLYASAVLAAPAYQVDKRAVALGEPIGLTLNARPGLLEKINLAPIARNFELRDQSLSRDSHSESLSVTLYPRTVGRLSLRIPGLPGRAPTIRVDEQSNLVPKVRLHVEIAPGRPVARQPFKLTIEACDDGSLLWKRPGLTTAEGLYIRNLSDSQLDVERDGERCTANRWQWAVTPTVAGAFTLAVPTLEAGKFGEQLRFPPPRVEFDVRAVPAWLPTDMAVGKVAALADAIPPRWPLNRPLARHLTVSGAYSLSSLRKILALQLDGQPAFGRYAPGIEPLPADNDSAMPRFDVTLYALPGKTGRFEFPGIRLPWFDAGTGRLDRVDLPPATVEIFDPRRAWWLRIGFGSLIAVGLALAAAFLYRAFRWQRSRRQALAAVAAARTPEQAVTALRAFTLSPDEAPAPTLRAWLAGIAPSNSALRRTAARLEQACYGDRPDDVNAIRDELIAQLRRVRPDRNTLVFGRRPKP